jgi:hypothetical protein
MRRIQYIEIHDQSWFPSAIRDEITDALQFGFNKIKAYSPIAPVLQDAFDSARPSASDRKTIVDLCSGGGGPWFDLAKKIQRRLPNGDPQPLQIWLTDKFPNVSGTENISKSDASLNHIAFYPSAVDATNVPRELKGFRTLFTSFHHFPPDQARSILQNAVDAGEGIGIFEITRRAPAAIARVFAWTAFLFFGTPWVRPFRWTRLLWTYVIPIIPLVLMHDGVVSCLRSYRPSEMLELVRELSTNDKDYEWKAAEFAANFWQPPVTYLIGCPRSRA